MVAEPVFVRRPPWGKDTVIDPLPVQGGDINSVGGCVEPCFGYLARHVNGPGQDGRRHVLSSEVDGADEVGHPIAGWEEAGLDDRPLAPRAPVDRKSVV